MNYVGGNKLEARVKLLFFGCLIGVYLVILAGGTVRAMGAGMGCPDWPLCFGQVFPPTSFEDLPINWKDFLHGKGLENPQFNPLHTWIEYINRLLGALLGLGMLFLVISTSLIRKKRPEIFFCALAAFFAVCFNGWLGSRVVASDLRPIMVSLHMLGAFVVQIFLILGLCKLNSGNLLKNGNVNSNKKLTIFVLVSLLLLIVQIGMGIQIRESVDWIIKTSEGVLRADLLNLVPWIFYVHRSFSWVIFGISGIMVYQIFFSNKDLKKKNISVWDLRFFTSKNLIGTLSIIYFLLVILQMLIGGALNHLGFPEVAQPIHLLVANLLFGVLCFMLFELYNFKSIRKEIKMKPLVVEA
ncbi:MAG: hypothetical protein CBC42_03535 [Betaproteobacteria bacterium TMED82]|nr:MAG: hypothetical protein CBC42_03535 [Betaproteobacteria bacterium TMED82]